MSNPDCGGVKRFPRRAHNPETVGSTPTPATNTLTESEFDMLLFAAALSESARSPLEKDEAALLTDFTLRRVRELGDGYAQEALRTGSAFEPLHARQS